MRSAITTLCLGALLTAPAMADWDHPVIWDQLEPLSTWGVASFICDDIGCYALTCDDYPCSGLPEERYVTSMEFYGWSLYGGDYNIERFRITFWTDWPATPDDAGHPDDSIYDRYVDRADASGIGWQYLGDNHFKVNLPEACWFDQGLEQRVLWIGIEAEMLTDGYPDYFYWNFLEPVEYPDHYFGGDAAFWSTCWEPPPWTNWGWPTPDWVDFYDGPFPDGWYASAEMSFRLSGIPEPASLAPVALGILLARRR